MDHRAAFVADVQTAVAMEPGQRALDAPSGLPETTAMRRFAAREHRAHASGAQLPAMLLRVVIAVPLDTDGPLAGRPRRPRNGGIPSTSGRSWVMSLRFAAVRMATSGMPRASVRM